MNVPLVSREIKLHCAHKVVVSISRESPRIEIMGLDLCRVL
jgi:hypothetical protein